MAADPWQALADELDLWPEPAEFWWRDDDAVAWSPALERLVEALDGVPFALAVIPTEAAADLPGTILQHGWRHGNHAGPAEKKAEFGPHRPQETMLTELEAGRERLEALYGGRFLAVLAPPWNRIDPALAARLPAAGWRGLSVFRPRRSPFETNAHVDPVAWRTHRGFRGEAEALGDIAAHLRARRTGTVDRSEPTGILSHHLVADEAGFAFFRELARFVAAHPRAGWRAPATLWPG